VFAIFKNIVPDSKAASCNAATLFARNKPPAVIFRRGDDILVFGD
jgi:hypothetical protein